MSTADTVTSLDGFHATAAAHSNMDGLLDRGFQSYDRHGTRSRTGLHASYAGLRRSFSDLRFDVHENVGVLVEGDLVGLRTIITGTHTGDYAGVTAHAIQASASHIFRVSEDRLVEHWPVADTYRILVAIGAIPRAATVFQEQYLRVEATPGGLFQERPRTEFGAGSGRRMSREESRAAVHRLYDGVIATGRADDVDIGAESYIQKPRLDARRPRGLPERHRGHGAAWTTDSLPDRRRRRRFRAGALAAGAHREPRRAVLFYATDDVVAAAMIERLIQAAGFDPLRAGGVAAAGRVEAPGGDLHQFGLNGLVPDLDQERTAVAAETAA